MDALCCDDDGKESDGGGESIGCLFIEWRKFCYYGCTPLVKQLNWG